MHGCIFLKIREGGGGKSSIVIHCHPLSSIVIQCHPLSSIVIHCHPLSSIVIHCHPLSSIVIHCHLLSSIVISHYSVIEIHEESSTELFCWMIWSVLVWWWWALSRGHGWGINMRLMFMIVPLVVHHNLIHNIKQKIYQTYL